MPSHCNHIVAHAGRRLITTDSWAAAVTEFSRLVDFFNRHTDRLQIIHPGHLEISRFCPNCGDTVDARGYGDQLAMALVYQGEPIPSRDEYNRALATFYGAPTTWTSQW